MVKQTAGDGEKGDAPSLFSGHVTTVGLVIPPRGGGIAQGEMVNDSLEEISLVRLLAHEVALGQFVQRLNGRPVSIPASQCVERRLDDATIVAGLQCRQQQLVVGLDAGSIDLVPDQLHLHGVVGLQCSPVTGPAIPISHVCLLCVRCRFFVLSHDQYYAKQISMRSSQLLKGVLELAVLAALETRRSYGLELVDRLREAGLVALADASVYGVLHRLERDGLLEAVLEPSTSGPARKYYELTARGREVLSGYWREWRDLTAALDGLLAGATDGRTVRLIDDHTKTGV